VTAGCLAVHCTEKDVLHKGSSSPRGTAAQRRGYISCSQLLAAVKEWKLEQLAAGDNRVGMSGLAVNCTKRDVLHKGSSSPRGTAAQRGGIDKLFTADDSCIGMQVRTAASS
jgi:hypothetical protein